MQDFPRSSVGIVFLVLLCKRKNTSEQKKYRVFNVEILSVPLLCQSLFHVMLSKYGTQLNASPSLGWSSFICNVLWLKGAEQSSESLVSKYWMVSTCGALHDSVSWPLKKPWKWWQDGEPFALGREGREVTHYLPTYPKVVQAAACEL